MSEVSNERRGEIITKYAGLSEDKIERIINGDDLLILQLVDVLTRKAEANQIEKIDLEDVASIVAEYFPLMSFQPMKCAEFLEQSFVD